MTLPKAVEREVNRVAPAWGEIFEAHGRAIVALQGPHPSLTSLAVVLTARPRHRALAVPGLCGGLQCAETTGLVRDDCRSEGES